MLSAHNPWTMIAAFRSYANPQMRAAAFRNRERWVRMSILNTARSGKFPTDRTIGEYNEEIWQLEPTPST